MDLLYILTNYPGYGGIEKVTTVLTTFLSTKGYNITVLAYMATAPELKEDIPCGVSLHYVPDETQFRSRNNTVFIKDFLFSHHFDYIILQDSFAPIEHVFEEIQYSWDKKLIVVEHNTPYHAIKNIHGLFNGKNDFKYTLKKLFRYPYSIIESIVRHRYLLKKCRCYIILSDSFKDELRIMAGQDYFNKVITITNPLTIPSVGVKVFLKNKQILFVGRLDSQKGIKYLMPIWKSFSKQDKEGWNLVIVGEGSERKFIEDFIIRENLSNIRIDNFTPEVSRYYEQSSILIMTSIFEGFPLVLAEAMSRGCIPIAFDSFKSIHDIVNTDNGVLVEPYNIKQYVKELMLLTSNEQLRLSKARNAQESAKRFEVNYICSQWISLFNKLND